MVTKNHRIGKIGEKLVSIELLKRGFEVWETGYNNPFFDLMISKGNGKVKTIQVKTSQSKNLKQGHFQFYLKNCKSNYDYIILVCLEKDNFDKKIFYIIQKDYVSLLTGINFTVDKENNYNQFKDCWDVLTKESVDRKKVKEFLRKKSVNKNILNRLGNFGLKGKHKGKNNGNWKGGKISILCECGLMITEWKSRLPKFCPDCKKEVIYHNNQK